MGNTVGAERRRGDKPHTNGCNGRRRPRLHRHRPAVGGHGAPHPPVLAALVAGLPPYWSRLFCILAHTKSRWCNASCRLLSS